MYTFGKRNSNQEQEREQVMDKYEFNPEDAFNRIQKHWRNWAASVGDISPKKWVIGISGGKDSTVVAALAARIFGEDSVYGLMMPNAAQKDIQDSIDICRHLGIKHSLINIFEAYDNIVRPLNTVLKRDFSISELSYDTTTNLPARLRMSLLYAFAQTIGGMVLNTSNLSEDVVGYATLWGDDTGSYAPIQGLTVTEIRQLGDWLGLPHKFVHKTPVDGLQSKTDEEKLGFKYEELDKYIREDEGFHAFKELIDGLYKRNKFKTDMVRIPGPNFDDLGNFVRYNNSL
jgi:NAD+ synthase